MTPRQKHIAFLTRDRDFIIRTAFGIGLFFFALAFLVHYLNPATSGSADAPDATPDARSLAEEIRDAGDSWLDPQTPFSVLAHTADQSPIPSRIANAGLPETTTGLLSRFHSALTTGRHEIEHSRTYFESFHADNPTEPFAAGFAAYLYAIGGNHEQALALYIAEGTHPDASFERAAALTIATNRKDRESLETLLALPRYRTDLPGALEDNVAIITGDFPRLLTNQFAHWYSHLQWSHLAVSIATGSVWFVIIFQTLGLRRNHLPIAFASVAAGVFSTAITLALLSLQEFYTEVELTGAIIDDAVYWIAGVGLREEFAKLACFAIILPFLRPLRSPTLAFACASFVGLGFAIEENNLYFLQSQSASALGRFLTANFLHLSTTGIAGYYLYRLTLGFKNNWEPALGAFLLVVFLHGAYDFLPNTHFEISRELGIASIFIIGILAFMHAKLTDELHIQDRRQIFSPLSVFVFGTAIITGFSFVVFVSLNASSDTFASSVSTFGQGSLSIITIAFLFINRLRTT